MCTRTPEKIEAIRRRRVIEARGVIEGSFPIVEVTSDLGQLAARCQVLFVASVTTAYHEVAQALGPVLDREHLLVLFSGKLCGSLEVVRALGGTHTEGPL